MITAFQKDKENFPGPKNIVVEQVELFMMGKAPLIPLSVHAGVPFIAFLAVTLALYVGAGVPIGAQRSGMPMGLSAHPHFSAWQELVGLAKDGLAYSQAAIGGGVRSEKAAGKGSGLRKESAGGGVDGRSLLGAEETHEKSKSTKSKRRESGSKSRKSGREERIDASDARVAKLLAKEEERARKETARLGVGAGVEEVYESDGRHQSQAAVRVRGLGADDDGDLALNLG